MKELLSKLSGFLFPFLLVTNIALIYQIYKLPSEMAKIGNLQSNPLGKKDTIIKVTTAQLKNKSNFIYFSGEISDKSFKILEQYDFDPKYPEEVYNGYLTHVKSSQGGEYYIWSKKKINKDKLSSKFNGWFVTDGLSKFQLNNTDKYLQVLYPIVEKEFDKKDKLTIP